MKSLHRLLLWSLITIIVGVASPLGLEDDALFNTLKTMYKPLFSFGQDILPYNTYAASCFLQQLGGLDYEFIEWVPSVKYGLTERSTIEVLLPVIAERINRNTQRGIGNLTLSFEHALYSHDDYQSNHQLTFLSAVLLPTAPVNYFGTFDVSLAQPSTTFFLGLTARHVSLDYYAYASFGSLIELSAYNTKYGTALLYNLGISMPLRFTNDYYYALMLEVSGRFRPSDVVDGVINDLTGSNRIWVGPVLRCVWSDYKLQFGFQYPVVERFFDPRVKPSYRVALQFSFN